MTHRSLWPALLILLIACSTVFAQEVPEKPISLEVGGSPGGGTWLTGGDGNAEANFNVYTIGFYTDWYATQKVALEGEYTFGFGMSQDITFQNGLLPGQQVPWTADLGGRVLYYPHSATARLPFYVAGGVGMLTLTSRRQTKNLGYDPDAISSGHFMATNIGAGVKLPRGKLAPNWSFRIDYRLLFINANDAAPTFFAQRESRTGHHLQFGMQYAFRR
jgi:hypothetical protein